MHKFNNSNISGGIMLKKVLILMFSVLILPTYLTAAEKKSIPKVKEVDGTLTYKLINNERCHLQFVDDAGPLQNGVITEITFDIAGYDSELLSFAGYCHIKKTEFTKGVTPDESGMKALNIDKSEAKERDSIIAIEYYYDDKTKKHYMNFVNLGFKSEISKVDKTGIYLKSYDKKVENPKTNQERISEGVIKRLNIKFDEFKTYNDYMGISENFAQSIGQDQDKATKILYETMLKTNSWDKLINNLKQKLNSQH